MSRTSSRAKPAPDKSTESTAKPTASERFWAELRGYAEALVVAFLVVTFLFNTVGVVGSSMRPSLDGGSGQLPQALFTGDRVFIPKYDTWLRRAGILGPYERGEIVVVREPPNSPTGRVRERRPFFIKRVVAGEGDTLKIIDGQVFVNGEPVDQSFITGTGEITPFPVNFPVVEVQDGEVVAFQGLSEGTFRGSPYDPTPVPVNTPNVSFYYGDTLEALAPIPEDAPEGEPFVHEIVIPEDHYFVMGDNRSLGGSEDSRYFGPIPSISVAGRATAIIWPPQRDGEWNWRSLEPPEAFEALPDAPPPSESALEG